MKIPSFFITLVLLFFTSCSTPPNLNKERLSFNQNMGRAKSELSQKDYISWLKKQLRNKEAELASIAGQKGRESKFLDHHEVMTESSVAVGGPQDVHGFKADRSRQAIQRLDERRKLLEGQIFSLKSQLSALGL